MWCFVFTRSSAPPEEGVSWGLPAHRAASRLAHRVFGSAISVPMKLHAAGFELVYRDELDALEGQNTRFRVLHALTRTTNDGWHRATGRIDQKLLQLAARDLADPISYVSGTPSMVVGMLRLLRGLHVPDSNIEIEAFRGYE